ncbi:hypothetical protein [Rufibacter roseus]|uniref:Uncharacterized protein n=1 Tax=Rufibacter roseus TaxID=1567108 RepID=A0ABW2DSZ6_9BACT|nr:hypothetical protein [Rufibacter roseus]
MKIQLTKTLVYDTELGLGEQEAAVQDYLNEIAFDYNNAVEAESVFEGTGEAGKPKRYSKLVHLVKGDTASIKTVVFWVYENEYGTKYAWSGTHSLYLEFIGNV